MSDTFYGTLQKVEVSPDRLLVRCVREFFYSDGLLADDVWIWEIDGADAAKITLLQAMVGHVIAGFEIDEGKEVQLLRIWFDESDEPVSIGGKRIGKREEPRGERDLEELVSRLAQSIFRLEAESSRLYEKLSKIATTVEQNIDRISRRATFQQKRAPEMPNNFQREIEDLQTILRRLKEPVPMPAPQPQPRGASGASNET